MDKYYLVVTEWLYPTESGSDIMQSPFTYESREEAIEECKRLCEDENDNYKNFAEPLPVKLIFDRENRPCGACLMAKDDMEEWWFAAKVVEITYGIDWGIAS